MQHANSQLKNTFILFFLIVTTIFTVPCAAAESPADIPVSFRIETFTVQNDTPQPDILLAVWITPQSGYHFYAHDPGDTGRPTEILPSPLISGMTVLYPQGIPSKDVFDPSATVNIHETGTPFFIRLPSTATEKSLTVTVKLLLCSDSNCWPVERTLTRPLSPPLSRTLACTRENGPDQAETQPWWPTLSVYTRVTPETQGEIRTTDTTKPAKLAADLGVQLPSSTAKPLGAPSGSLTAPQSLSPGVAPEAGYTLTPRFFLQALEVTSLRNAILLGLLAGFLLNFMPCVLPVISLKLSSLVSAAGVIDENKRVASFREHNIYFAAGIMVWFVMLAALFSSAGLAWGQLFQNDKLVTGLLILIFLLGLSTFGMFELPMIYLHGSTSQNRGPWSAFSTGLLATLLATPCSGPFLGGVLGWAFLQPPLILATILIAVGTGMALPYLCLAAWPELVRHFPRPGTWTVVLQRIVGFFLMGTTGYLLTILPAEKLPKLLVILWVTAFAAWIWGNFAGLNVSRLRRRSIRTLCVVLIATPFLLNTGSNPQSTPWVTFDRQTFHSALGNRTMLVDFTADWCPNCKILEHSVLTDENRARWAQKYNLTYIKVDLTRSNPEGEALLRALGSQSIPVVALFPAGAGATSPVVLRDLFTTEQAEAALEEAFGTQNEAGAAKSQ